MSTSEAMTRGVHVRIRAQYAAEHSRPVQDQWFFSYTVQITNEGTEAVQLVSRHWIITDGEGRVEEVRGLGVVGQQPVLAPGQSFEYTSGCPLTTPYGEMKGAYQMVTAGGETFEVEIAPFVLCEPYPSRPYTVH